MENQMFEESSLLLKLRVWLQWIIASMIGWTLGLVFAEIAGTVMPFKLFLFPGDILAYLIVGLSLGTTQWLVIRQQLPNISSWIFATGLGVAIGWNSGLSDIAIKIGSDLGLYIWDGSNLTFHFILPAFSGSILGILQWLILRSRIQGAGWWLLGSAIGEATASVLYHAAFTGFWGTMKGGLIAYLGVGEGVGFAISGLTLVYLLRSLSPKAKILQQSI
jgi:hypothetical protein